MNLKIQKDQWNNETHSGPLFPGAEDRQFAYQGESVRGGMTIELHISGLPPHRAEGKLNHELEESVYSAYRLTIERSTGKALYFKLSGIRKDIVEQRKANGFAVTEDVLAKTLTFGELANMIFSSGAQVFYERESFPKSVEEELRKCYR
jgi:hypothetical protein